MTQIDELPATQKTHPYKCSSDVNRIEMDEIYLHFSGFVIHPLNNIVVWGFKSLTEYNAFRAMYTEETKPHFNMHDC